MEELAVLQELHEELKSENINVVGILRNYEETKDEVAKIIDTSGITYTNIIPDEKFNREFVNCAIGNPTTLFIDGKGNLVGEIIVGAIKKDDYEKAIRKALEKIK